MATPTVKQKLEIKYEPLTFETLALPVRIQKLINNTMNQDGYRAILYGPAGTGKTTTSKLMTKGHEVMYLSGSNDFKMETMTKKVYPFLGGMSALGKKKTLVIDEFENVSNKIQDAFKIIHDKARHVNIIFITNEVEKVIPEIMSRFTKIEYNYSDAELNEQRVNYIKFIQKVLIAENLKYDKTDSGSSTAIEYLYKQNYPDFRKVLVAIETIQNSNIDFLTENTIKTMSVSAVQNLELYALIDSEHDPKRFYEGISIFTGKEHDCFVSLAEPYFRYLNNKGLHEKTLQAAQIVGHWSNIYVTTFNKFATFMACCSQLKSLFK